ncbi:hypothetical protein RHGRI_002884 [Rhododendron griersonianum]|uniref:Uncharacterized protein n=1 Tax=Rhododendron griersonianum TaxID=479676 RepID=A0AAV6LRV7_9ERIC|nr:hypothetical protein RHGRI_002884 [Rhododendron griersonianum]
MVGFVSAVFASVLYLPFDQCLKIRLLGLEEMPRGLGTSCDTNWLFTSMFW